MRPRSPWFALSVCLSSGAVCRDVSPAGRKMTTRESRTDMPDARKPSKEEILALLKSHLSKWNMNMARIGALLLGLDALPASLIREAPEIRDDILRAAVVFLHATLEEFLRTVASFLLPQASEETLNTIPLLGSRDLLRPEKFFLGRLIHHRGRTVDEVIEGSVREHLLRVSFNDPGDVKRLLHSCGIATELIDGVLPAIGEMMARRHQIVHQADIPPWSVAPAPIDRADVAKWQKAVEDVALSVTAVRVVDAFSKTRVEDPHNDAS